MRVTKQQRQQYNQWLGGVFVNSNSTSAVPQSEQSHTGNLIGRSETNLANGHRLLSHLVDLVDELTEARQDWITLLHWDWNAHLCIFNLLTDGKNAVFQDRAIRKVSNIVSWIPQSHYQPIIVGQQLHWVYTCCLQIVGLGRVRLVIDYNPSTSNGPPIILATNRLDWSSRGVLRRWFERRPTSDSNELETNQGLIVEVFASD